MRVLVTGGAGYIGSHACKALAAAGHEPVTFDSLSQGHRWAVRHGPLEVGDVTDEARLAEVIARWRPEAVMHFAALISVGESVAQPELYYRTNVAGAVAVLSAMRAAGIDRFVFSSTCAVHGPPASLPITEDMAYGPISPYGRSKAMVEQILADCAGAWGLRCAALRYFNASGADPDGELGEAHDPETHLIPLVLAAARDGTTLILNGDDYATPDGTCVRDYIHVADLARAHVLALDRLAQADGFRAYNLGVGQGFSVKEIIEAARAVTGKTIAVEIGPRRPGDPPSLYADPSRAAAELGFTAGASSVRTIVETAWKWMIDPPPYAAA
ncbi:MAG TPA: UDP-glucose 4-epimerase GalE [Caulobacteraceae bacterium]|jgi:UDP-arabinose 4-epimerase|nr:UDP-glucose 4-epimerase GalE [Caulobacteraceae bacterium]